MTKAFDELRHYPSEPLTEVLRRHIAKKPGYRGGHHRPASMPEYITEMTDIDESKPTVSGLTVTIDVSYPCKKRTQWVVGCEDGKPIWGYKNPHGDSTRTPKDATASTTYTLVFTAEQAAHLLSSNTLLEVRDALKEHLLGAEQHLNQKEPNS
jgi:hypothetical protein